MKKCDVVFHFFEQIISMPFFHGSLQFKNFKFLGFNIAMPINIWEVMGGNFNSWINKKEEVFSFLLEDGFLMVEEFKKFPEVYKNLSKFKPLSLEDRVYKNLIYLLLDRL